MFALGEFQLILSYRIPRTTPLHSPNTMAAAYLVWLWARDSTLPSSCLPGIIFCISQMWKQWWMEGKLFSDKYPIHWQNWDLKAGSSISEAHVW